MSDISESSVTCALHFSRVCPLFLQQVQLPHPTNLITWQMPKGAPTSNPPLTKQQATTACKISKEAASQGKPACRVVAGPACWVVAGPAHVVYLYAFDP